MDLKNFEICENHFVKARHRAIPRMVFSRDVIRFNAAATKVLMEMDCQYADVFISLSEKKIALVGKNDGGVKLQGTGARMLREMGKALKGLYEFDKPMEERVTWGHGWGYSRHEYECTTVAEIDTVNKAIVFDISNCTKIE